MAKDSGKKQEDLELAPEKADEVKGGVRPPEGGGVTRKLSVKKAHKKQGVVKNYSGGKHY